MKMGELVREYETQIKAGIDERQIELPKNYKKILMKERRGMS